jgi:hypothetical protein
MCARPRCAVGQDHVRGQRNQFRRVFAHVVGTACGPPNVDAHVAAHAPAQFLQPLQERRNAGLPFGIVRGKGYERADAPHALRLLRPRRNRPPRPPRRRAA